ncbi:MAG: hypothetical protein GF375_02620 [Candidatus Omnitrophica bacterium]|nr:hypothetical protein [Candidatus Omnitrophota bacterium]
MEQAGEKGKSKRDREFPESAKKELVGSTISCLSGFRIGRGNYQRNCFHKLKKA